MSDNTNDNGTAGRSTQYVTFLLDSELYAVDVRNARTVIHEASITRIPHMEEFVAGIIDFRGHGIPLIDLKIKLGITGRSKSDPASGAPATAGAPGQPSSDTRGDARAGTVPAATEVPPDSAVLILEIPRGEGHITVGVIVDEVHEVIALDEDAIETAPTIGSACNLEFLRGIARNDDTFLLILHADRILESQEVVRLAEQAPSDHGSADHRSAAKQTVKA